MGRGEGGFRVLDFGFGGAGGGGEEEFAEILLRSAP